MGCLLSRGDRCSRSFPEGSKDFNERTRRFECAFIDFKNIYSSIPMSFIIVSPTNSTLLTTCFRTFHSTARYIISHISRFKLLNSHMQQFVCDSAQSTRNIATQRFFSMFFITFLMQFSAYRVQSPFGGVLIRM